MLVLWCGRWKLTKAFAVRHLHPEDISQVPVLADGVGRVGGSRSGSDSGWP